MSVENGKRIIFRQHAECGYMEFGAVFGIYLETYSIDGAEDCLYATLCVLFTTWIRAHTRHQPNGKLL